MNLARLITLVGDMADAVGENATEQTRICESAERLFMANQVEDASALLAKAIGMSEANNRVLTVLREIQAEIARGG